MEPAQIRAARALLGMNQRELSKLAEVAISTVKRIETSVEMTGSVRTLWQLQSALEQAGVEFNPRGRIQGAWGAPQASRIRQQRSIKEAQALVDHGIGGREANA
jgi:transcriptional regulator with XRE-family HTH domain